MEGFEDNVTFEDVFDETFKKIEVGSIVTGTIININEKDEIFVDIGYKADGLIPKSEIYFSDSKDPHDEFKAGDKIQAVVLKLNDGLGNVLMSYKKAMEKIVREDFRNKVANNEVFTEKVVGAKHNGLIVQYRDAIRIFIPLSLSNISKNEEITDYIGKDVKFRVIENDERNRKIIGSIKILVEEERKAEAEKFWNEIEVGKKYKGIVNSLSDYGAFVDIGGFQGLLHVSEMTWARNENPRNILQVGETIDVTVKELDKENKRFKLSYDKKGPSPWTKVEEKYHVGDVVKVKVSKLMPFGAFVELEKGIEGLVHISQICERKISKPEEELQVGKKVNAKIIDIDTEHQKLELSIRDLEGTSNEFKEE